MNFIRKKFVFPDGKTSWSVFNEKLGSLEFRVITNEDGYTFGGIERHYNEELNLLTPRKSQIIQIASTTTENAGMMAHRCGR